MKFKHIFGGSNKAEGHLQSSVTGDEQSSTADPTSGNVLPFRMVIDDRFFLERDDHPCVVTGKVESGTLQSGDKIIIVTKSNMRIEGDVDFIEQFRKRIDKATAGNWVGIRLSSPSLTTRDYFYNHVSFGDVLYALGSEPQNHSSREVAPPTGTTVTSVTMQRTETGL